MTKLIPLQKIINFLLFACLATFPLAIGIALISPQDPAHPILAVKISLADIFMGITFVLWFINVLIAKQIKKIKLPLTPVIVFIALCFFSYLNTASIKDWAKEFIQLFEYFIVLYILLINNRHVLNSDYLLKILMIQVLFILLLAVYQYFAPDTCSYLVRGTFENRHLLGTYCCFVAPLLFGKLIYAKNYFQKFLFVTALLLIALVLLSPSALFSIGISLFILGLFSGKKVLIRFMAFSLIIGIAYTLFLDKNIQAIKEFTRIYEGKEINYNFYKRQSLITGLQKEIFSKEIGTNRLQVNRDQWESAQLPEFEVGNRYKKMITEKHIQNRFIEMQAALNMTCDNFLLGVGAGNFQNLIGKYYQKLPKVNTAEPNQHNGYLILSSTTGILGLAAFFWILFFYGINAVKLVRTKETKDRGLYLGLLGAIIAISLNNIFCVIVVSSLITPLILILALLHNSKAPSS